MFAGNAIGRQSKQVRKANRRTKLRAEKNPLIKSCQSGQDEEAREPILEEMLAFNNLIFLSRKAPRDGNGREIRGRAHDGADAADARPDAQGPGEHLHVQSRHLALAEIQQKRDHAIRVRQRLEKRAPDGGAPQDESRGKNHASIAFLWRCFDQLDHPSAVLTDNAEFVQRLYEDEQQGEEEEGVPLNLLQQSGHVVWMQDGRRRKHGNDRKPLRVYMVKGMEQQPE